MQYTQVMMILFELLELKPKMALLIDQSLNYDYCHLWLHSCPASIQFSFSVNHVTLSVPSQRYIQLLTPEALSLIQTERKLH